MFIILDFYLQLLNIRNSVISTIKTHNLQTISKYFLFLFLVFSLQKHLIYNQNIQIKEEMENG